MHSKLDRWSVYDKPNGLPIKKLSILSCLQSIMQLQWNHNYPDSLGLDEIVRIIEGPDNQKYEYWWAKNCLNKATFKWETTLLQIVWKTIWSTVLLEPLLWANQNSFECSSLVTTCASAAFANSEQNKLAIDCTFQWYSFNKYSACKPWLTFMT